MKIFYKEGCPFGFEKFWSLSWTDLEGKNNSVLTLINYDL